MFDGTIIDNIGYGKPDADDKEIIAAAKKANIHEFIMSLDDGYDTFVGERGNHDKLLQKDGIYSYYYNMQFKDFDSVG